MKNTYKKNPSQVTLILWHLKEGNKLTAMDALKLFNCWRLSGRILTIRKMGFSVLTKFVKTPSDKTVAEYSLLKGCYQTKLF